MHRRPFLRKMAQPNASNIDWEEIGDYLLYAATGAAIGTLGGWVASNLVPPVEKYIFRESETEKWLKENKKKYIASAALTGMLLGLVRKTGINPLKRLFGNNQPPA